MKLDFDEGVALVAGGSGGIGAAVVLALTAERVPVALTYNRGRQTAEKLAESVAGGVRTLCLPWSGSDFEQAGSLLRAVSEKLGPVRHLVIASGIAQESALYNTSEEEVRRLSRCR